MTIWRMCIACWITEATNTHSEYVIVIPFQVEQWSHERVAFHSRLPHCLRFCRSADWHKMIAHRPPRAAVPLAATSAVPGCLTADLSYRSNSVQSGRLTAG